MTYSYSENQMQFLFFNVKVNKGLLIEFGLQSSLNSNSVDRLCPVTKDKCLLSVSSTWYSKYLNSLLLESYYLS